MDDKITISLSASQRKLLLKYEPFFSGHDLFRLISVAVKKDKGYEIYLDKEQVEDLLDQVSELCNNEENKEMQDKLDDLCDHLETYSDEFEDDADYSEHSSNTGSVCILKVALEGDPKIWRRIAIRGGQTLNDLHNIIFDAFDRDDEHLYSFYFPTKSQKPHNRYFHRDSVEYTHPFNLEERGFDDDSHFNAAMTSLESLKLTKNQQLYYLFDFGDSWWHIITVEDTEGKADNQKYPRILERKGKSPEQYEYPD